ncbi:MAG: hypothetical protein JWO53_695 [Chlamydiia bacterium]|nr:hypothetical protein [Chlamydiia bacterium]
MKTLKESSILFISMFFMLLFVSFENILLSSIQDKVVVTTLGDFFILFLKAAVLPISLLTGSGLLILGRDGHIERTFKVFFISSTSILATLALTLFVHPSLIQSSYFTGVLYLVIVVVPLLSLVLIFGYANQRYTFKMAALQYPILIFLFYLMNRSPLVTLEFSHSLVAVNFAVAALLNLFILTIYALLSHCELGPQENGISTTKWYWRGIALLVTGIAFAKHSIQNIYSLFVKHIFTIPQVVAELNAYKYPNIDFSLILWALGITCGILLFLYGPKIFLRISGGLLSIICAGGVFFLYNTPFIMNNPPEVSRSVLAIGGHGIFLSAIPVFLILAKELAYFGVALKDRFAAKLKVDIFVFLLAPILSSLPKTLIIVIIQFSGTQFQSVATGFDLLYKSHLLESIALVGFILGIVLCSIGIVRINRELNPN